MGNEPSAERQQKDNKLLEWMNTFKVPGDWTLCKNRGYGGKIYSLGYKRDKQDKDNFEREYYFGVFLYTNESTLKEKLARREISLEEAKKLVELLGGNAKVVLHDSEAFYYVERDGHYIYTRHSITI